MPLINHMNLANEDNEVYCCLRNRVVTADREHKNTFCLGCQMYQGDLDGQGIQCSWEDDRKLVNPCTITDPYQEWMANQKRKTQLSAVITDSANSDIVIAG